MMRNMITDCLFLGDQGKGWRTWNWTSILRFIKEVEGEAPSAYTQQQRAPVKKRRGCRAGRQKISKKEKKGHLNDGIYNSCKAKLDHKELNIFNLGLKCAPKKPLNEFEVYIITHKFIQKLNTKIYFLRHPLENGNRVVADSQVVDW